MHSKLLSAFELLSQKFISDKTNWFLDSGCTQHMSGAHWPKTKQNPSSVSITTANGTLKSIGNESIKIENLQITDTLFYPSSVPNLLVGKPYSIDSKHGREYSLRLSAIGDSLACYKGWETKK